MKRMRRRRGELGGGIAEEFISKNTTGKKKTGKNSGRRTENTLNEKEKMVIRKWSRGGKCSFK